MDSATALVKNVTELISFPDIAIRINQSLDDENSTAKSVSDIIEQDPALTASMLKLANSPVYSGGAQIDSVAKAFMRIGSREIQELTFGICATQAFSGIPNELISVEDFWRHSLASAVAARLLGRHLKLRNAGMLFTAGLLHDVGHLVMFSLRPEQSIKALALSRNEMDGEDLYLAERQVFGFDHMDVGRELGQLWQWPEALVNCIARHHDPFSHDDYTNHDVLIHVANSLATMAELESCDLTDAAPMDERSWGHLKLEPEDAIGLVAELDENAGPLLKLFVA